MAKDDPCIGVCQWNGRTGWCLGCGRTVAEIKAWRKLTPYRRGELARELPRRITQPYTQQQGEPTRSNLGACPRKKQTFCRRSIFSRAGAVS